MRFCSVIVVLAGAGLLLVSSSVARVGPTIGPANTGPATVADVKPVVSPSRPKVPRDVLENNDRNAALGLLLLIGMFEDRRGR